MNDYDDDDEFFSEEFEFLDDEDTDISETRRRGSGLNWRKIELARERLALRRELGDFDFGIE